MNGLREIESGNGDPAKSQKPVVGIKDLSQTGLTSLDHWIGGPQELELGLRSGPYLLVIFIWHLGNHYTH